MRKLNELTNRERKFLSFYLEHFNGALASKQAGYSTKSHSVNAYEILKRREVQTFVQKRLEPYNVTIEIALQKLVRIASGDIANFLSFNEKTSEVYIDIKKAMDENNTYLIKSLRRTTHGFVIELHDPIKAIDAIAMIKGWKKTEFVVDPNRMTPLQELNQYMEEALRDGIIVGPKKKKLKAARG
jgi:hypothetical protein